MTKPRKFTLLDALILIGSTAVSLGIIRAVWYSEPMIDDHLPLVVLKSVLACLASLTFALMVIRLLPSRPKLSRLARQPGFVASVAAGFGLSVIAVFWAATRLSFYLKGRNSDQIVNNFLWLLGIHSAGLSVASSWLTLALAGCGFEPTWIDRAARALGVLWLLALVGFWFELIREF